MPPDDAGRAVSDPPRSTATPGVLLAVALLSAGVLALEIILTRILSVLTWHHFVFLILGTALLGFGAAGTTLTVWEGRGKRGGEGGGQDRADDHGIASPRHIPLLATLFGASGILSVYLVVLIRPEPLWIAQAPIEIIKLIACELLVATPFYFAGLCLGHLITRYGHDIGRVYFADLAAGGLGSLVSTVAIERVGAVNAVLLIASMGIGAGMLLRTGPPAPSTGRALALPVLLGLLLFAVEPPDLFFVPPSRTKELDGVMVYGPPSVVLAMSRWHPIARVDVAVDADVVLRGFGGSIDPTLHLRAREHLIFQDGSAVTSILRTDGNLGAMPFLGSYLQASPYALRKNARTLVIGVGGGSDILIALFHGAVHVTGVEVNPFIVDAITHRFRDYSGGIFTSPRVDIRLAEGRHFIQNDTGEYDVVQLSGVDTLTALALGAHALTENYLYTREAIGEFWRRLAPRGILSFSRHLMFPPRESLRIAATMAQTLDGLGVPDPYLHVAIVGASGWADTMLQRAPFTLEEVQTLRQWAARHHFDVIYDPFKIRPSYFDAVLRISPELREVFFQNYGYDVRPTTDDCPFFFDYYKWRNLLHLEPGRSGYPATRLPFGLMTLTVSLAIGLALSGILILLPLRRLESGVFRRPGHRAMLIYFGGLGLGYITVEIVTIQKLMVFLGGPAYATSVALFALLVFSGLGSLATTRLDVAGRPRMRALLELGLAGLILLLCPATAAMETAASGWGLVGRALLTTIVLAPMAFLMGMPFPVGIRRLSATAPEWIPWAWAANAFATVVASSGCVLVGMTVGFSTTLQIAAVVYLVAFAALERLLSRTR